MCLLASNRFDWSTQRGSSSIKPPCESLLPSSSAKGNDVCCYARSPHGDENVICVIVVDTRFIMSHAETAAQAKPAPAAEDSRLSTQHQRKPGKVTAADFDYGRILGAGSFGNVFHVCLRGTDHEYAMKIMQKSFIRKEQKVRVATTGRSLHPA